MEMNFAQQGFVIVRDVLSDSDRQELLDVLADFTGAGKRGLLSEPVVSKLARSPAVLDLVRPHVPAEPRPVRVIYFNKSAEANWLVPWHQDLTIAVQEKADVAGFSPWSVKDGI